MQNRIFQSTLAANNLITIKKIWRCCETSSLWFKATGMRGVVVGDRNAVTGDFNYVQGSPPIRPCFFLSPIEWRPAFLNNKILNYRPLVGKGIHIHCKIISMFCTFSFFEAALHIGSMVHTLIHRRKKYAWGWVRNCSYWNLLLRKITSRERL